MVCKHRQWGGSKKNALTIWTIANLAFPEPSFSVAKSDVAIIKDNRDLGHTVF